MDGSQTVSRRLSASEVCRSRNERPSGRSQLGGEDSNPQLQGQNLPCCRLHHPRMGGVIVTGAAPEPAGSRGKPRATSHSYTTSQPKAATRADKGG